MKLRLAFLISILALASADDAPNKDFSQCGLTPRGIEVIEAGEVHELMGEVTIVSLIDLSEADATRLDSKNLPEPCHRNSTAPSVKLLCRAIGLDLDRWHSYVHGSSDAFPHNSGTSVVKREKRQIAVALGIGISALIGYFGGRLFKPEDNTKLREALDRLAKNDQILDTEILELSDDLVALTSLVMENKNKTQKLRQEVDFIDHSLLRLFAALDKDAQTVQDLAKVMTFKTMVDGVKDSLEHNRHLASQRYEGLISGQAHRLSPSVINPGIFYAKLEEIRLKLSKEHKMDVSFGSRESAYVGTRVVYSDIHSSLARDNTSDPPRVYSRMTAEVVWKVPYFSAGQKAAKLYRLRSYPMDTVDIGNNTRVQAQLRAPYVAIKSDKEARIASGLRRGEFYQLIDAEDLRDTGNGSWINMAPSAFEHSSETPSCEYSSIRNEPEALDRCLLQSKAVRAREFVTLNSGCWLIAMKNKEQVMTQTCVGGDPPQRLIPIRQDGRFSLVKPKCGCRYKTKGRMFPASSTNCMVEKHIVLNIPETHKDDIMKLITENNRIYQLKKEESMLSADYAQVESTFLRDDRVLKKAIDDLSFNQPFFGYEKKSSQSWHQSVKEYGDSGNWWTIVAICLCSFTLSILTALGIFTLLERSRKAAKARLRKKRLNNGNAILIKNAASNQSN